MYVHKTTDEDYHILVGHPPLILCAYTAEQSSYSSLLLDQRLHPEGQVALPCRPYLGYMMLILKYPASVCPIDDS